MRSLSSKKSITGIFILILLLPPFVLANNEITERRISIGLRFFRSLLASDNKLPEKLNVANQLNLLLISTKDPSESQEIAEQLLNAGRANSKGKIRGFPINISISTTEQLSASKHTPLAGIYLTDKLSQQQLTTIINYGISHQIIVYSPFEGDVQAGILAGLDISINVRPYINSRTLKKSQLVIKALFLKVSKFYED